MSPLRKVGQTNIYNFSFGLYGMRKEEFILAQKQYVLPQKGGQ